MEHILNLKQHEIIDFGYQLQEDIFLPPTQAKLAGNI